MPPTGKRSSDIPRLDYHPPAPYRLDLEIFSVSDLRRRGSREKVHTTHRYAFHILVLVTEGRCSQLVDFNPIPCEPGSLLTIRPGQVHNFGHEEVWDGWIILFRPEFLLPTPMSASGKQAAGIERLPEHLHLRGHELHSVLGAIAQMQQDTVIEAQPEDLHALLRHQLYALLSRLRILRDRQDAQALLSSGAMQRFRRFRQLLEQRFAKWHQVTEYAEQLGCTEKSLTRAAMAGAGMSAKAFIASRINLEAKRLLVHTDSPVTLIAEELGFEEATNFSKFFKRETGCTPSEFRRRQVAANRLFGRGA